MKIFYFQFSMIYSGGFVLGRCPTVKFYMIDSSLIKNKKLFHSHVSLLVSKIADRLWPCWPFFVFQLFLINLIFQRVITHLNIQRIILYQLGMWNLLIHLSFDRNTSHYFKLFLFYAFVFLCGCNYFKKGRISTWELWG